MEDYKIIRAGDFDKLAEIVTEFLGRGYKLAGGVCTTVEHSEEYNRDTEKYYLTSDTTFFQAIFKEAS